MKCFAINPDSRPTYDEILTDMDTLLATLNII